MDSRGAIILVKPEESRARFEARQLTNLIRVGGKLAVLGVEDNHRAMGWWHVMQPGSYGTPSSNSFDGNQEGNNLVYGKSLCGKINIVSNGYAADWRPPKGALCPACSERI